jgi:hypothetical protein
MKCVVLTVAMVVAISAVGQQTNAGKKPPGDLVPSQQKVVSDSPPLSDTVDFMNRVLADDSAGTMTSSGGCDVSLVRQRLGDVTLPSGAKKVPGNYQTGIPDRYEYLWRVFDPASHLRSDFNLKDIDPDSVKVIEAFSIETIAHRGDSTNPILPSKDRSIVSFSASNLAKAIHQTDFVDRNTIKNKHENGTEIGFLFEPGTSSRLAKDRNGDLLLFENNGMALRFTKAFKHAVELCGGKPSAF